LSAGGASAQVDRDDISGFSTLLVTPAARHAAMGNSTGSTAGDLFSLYSNPAGILSVDHFSVGFSHSEWIADYRSEYAGLVYHPSDFAIGLSVNYGTVGDIERRSGPTQEPEGYFDLNDLVAGLTMARAFSPQLRLGLSAKLVYEKIDIYSSTGFAFDFGFQYLVSSQLTLGASFANLGTKLKLDEEEYDLPRILRAGASYLIADFLISGDMIYPTDDDPHFHVGGEYNFNRMFYLRSGFQSGYDEKDISFGLGVNHRGINLDYAYIPFKSDLGDTHRISFTYSLSKEE
jgi:hypothetical protein